MGGSARASNTSLRVRGAPRGPLCCSRRRPAYKRQTLTGGGRTATAVPCRGPTAAQASAAQSCRAVHGSSMAWRTTAARVRVFIDAFIDAIRTCAAPRARAQCSHTCTHMHRHTHTHNGAGHSARPAPRLASSTAHSCAGTATHSNIRCIRGRDTGLPQQDELFHRVYKLREIRCVCTVREAAVDPLREGQL